MPMLKHIAAFTFALSASWAQAQTYSITEFGARNDSTVSSTKAIQAAIDRCHGRGGGEVVVPAGTYLTGTLFLKSNVYLHLLPGAVLQGSYQPADYPAHPIASAKKFGTITHNGLYVETMKALIIADKAHHTGLIGQGTVKGAGEGQAFQLGLNKDGKPKNLFFIGCTDVLLSGIYVLNSAQITVSISGCERVRIDGITIRSLVNWNCDGLDVDARDAIIANCRIDSEDDALCFKSEYLGRFCENITVTNCVLSSLCNGLKFGTGSRTGFRNITVSNCVIKRASVNGYRHWTMTPDVVYEPDVQSVNTGIVILGVDGGLVENINISDIIMTDVLSPLFIRVGKRFVNPDGKPSVMRHISIQNIRAESRSIIPSAIAGLEESPLEDIRLSNIRIANPMGVSVDSLKTFPVVVREDVKGYPENRLTFGTRLPASAFYVKHVNGLLLDNVSVTNKEKDSRPAFYLDDVTGIRLQRVFVDAKKLEKNAAMIRQEKTQLLEVID